VEFLNNNRNIEKYMGDPFGPANYSFDYLFAITMMAQPLAWFEATGLPPEAFAVAPLIKKYREIQTDVHSGIILPIGSEPCGTGWTGFQSIKSNKGYFLVFRELNEQKSFRMQTWLSPGTRVKLEPVRGDQKTINAKVDEEGKLLFTLQKPNSFGFYNYTVLNP
jgi:hypothetical protein